MKIRATVGSFPLNAHAADALSVCVSCVVNDTKIRVDLVFFNTACSGPWIPFSSEALVSLFTHNHQPCVCLPYLVDFDEKGQSKLGYLGDASTRRFFPCAIPVVGFADRIMRCSSTLYHTFPFRPLMLCPLQPIGMSRILRLHSPEQR